MATNYLDHSARQSYPISYIEYRDCGYWISSTRVSLDSVVYAFKKGLSPESIRQCFPLLTLEQVYGAITFYLGNQEEIDAYLMREEIEFDSFPQPLENDDLSLYEKLISAKKKQFT